VLKINKPNINTLLSLLDIELVCNTDQRSKVMKLWWH